MKKKRVLTLILLSFIMVTSTMKADFWSKLRDALIGGDNYSNSSSEDKNIVDGKIYNPKDNREYRLVEKMKDERENSQSDYRKFENSSSKIFYYECTINPKDFLSIIGFRTFYGYADFPVYEISSGVEKCYEKKENEYKKEVSKRKIYIDNKLAKYILKNEINVQKIAVYDAKLNDRGYPLFSSKNPRVLINDKLVSY
ncbi:Uncharacterised protein [uncultured Leptotrichia sp.]|jgi:hypothetical protein|uniref:hypothetical protein n=1 Tax=uncultured Leptotrichia sp. TaxID=159271 RepID=UPI001A5607FF|nr:hypothetical protein [uncultured Leptotrichia sp.]VTX48647.1 Uncharacterised protein [uncultured Leptotrichia sp.]